MQSSSSDKVTKAFILLYLGEILSNEVYLEFLSSLFTRSKLYRIVPRRVFKSLNINYKELQKHILNTSRIPKKDSTIEIDVVLNYLKDKNMLKLSEMFMKDVLGKKPHQSGTSAQEVIDLDSESSSSSSSSESSSSSSSEDDTYVTVPSSKTSKNSQIGNKSKEHSTSPLHGKRRSQESSVLPTPNKKTKIHTKEDHPSLEKEIEEEEGLVPLRKGSLKKPTKHAEEKNPSKSPILKGKAIKPESSILKRSQSKWTLDECKKLISSVLFSNDDVSNKQWTTKKKISDFASLEKVFLRSASSLYTRWNTYIIPIILSYHNGSRTLCWRLSFFETLQELGYKSEKDILWFELTNKLAIKDVSTYKNLLDFFTLKSTNKDLPYVIQFAIAMLKNKLPEIQLLCQYYEDLIAKSEKKDSQAANKTSLVANLPSTLISSTSHNLDREASCSPSVRIRELPPKTSSKEGGIKIKSNLTLDSTNFSNNENTFESNRHANSTFSWHLPQEETSANVTDVSSKKSSPSKSSPGLHVWSLEEDTDIFFVILKTNRCFTPLQNKQLFPVPETDQLMNKLKMKYDTISKRWETVVVPAIIGNKSIKQWEICLLDRLSLFKFESVSDIFWEKIRIRGASGSMLMNYFLSSCETKGTLTDMIKYRLSKILESSLSYSKKHKHVAENMETANSSDEQRWSTSCTRNNTDRVRGTASLSESSSTLRTKYDREGIVPCSSRRRVDMSESSFYEKNNNSTVVSTSSLAARHSNIQSNNNIEVIISYDRNASNGTSYSEKTVDSPSPLDRSTSNPGGSSYAYSSPNTRTTPRKSIKSCDAFSFSESKTLIDIVFLHHPNLDLESCELKPSFFKSVYTHRPLHIVYMHWEKLVCINLFAARQENWKISFLEYIGHWGFKSFSEVFDDDKVEKLYMHIPKDSRKAFIKTCLQFAETVKWKDPFKSKIRFCYDYLRLKKDDLAKYDDILSYSVPLFSPYQTKEKRWDSSYKPRSNFTSGERLQILKKVIEFHPHVDVSIFIPSIEFFTQIAPEFDRSYITIQQQWNRSIRNIILLVKHERLKENWELKLLDFFIENDLKSRQQINWPLVSQTFPYLTSSAILNLVVKVIKHSSIGSLSNKLKVYRKLIKSKDTSQDLKQWEDVIDYYEAFKSNAPGVL